MGDNRSCGDGVCCRAKPAGGRIQGPGRKELHVVPRCDSNRRKKATKEEWTEVLKNMQAYGLTVSDADFAKIVDYLAANFGTGAAPAQGGGGAAQSPADEWGLPAGEGRDVVATACTGCHDLEGVKNKKLTVAEWKDIVNNMVGYGATLSDAQVTAVSEYLAKAYPK